jgi:hypothetical protein
MPAAPDITVKIKQGFQGLIDAGIQGPHVNDWDAAAVIIATAIQGAAPATPAQPKP